MQGRTEEQILIQAAQDGMPIPDAILNAPEIYEGDDLFLKGFEELDTCRSVGLGKGQIPWTAIYQYCMFNGFDEELAFEFNTIIRLMDTEILNHEHEQAEIKRLGDKGRQNGK